MFGKLFARGTKAAKQLNNKDLFEAAVAAGVLTAWADGDFSDSEFDGLLSLLEANPALSAYKSEIPALVESYSNQMKVSFRAGKRNLMKQVADCDGDQDESEQVLILALDVADIDGEVSPEEKKILTEVASKLGLRLADYE